MWWNCQDPKTQCYLKRHLMFANLSSSTLFFLCLLTDRVWNKWECAYAHILQRHSSKLFSSCLLWCLWIKKPTQTHRMPPLTKICSPSLLWQPSSLASHPGCVDSLSCGLEHTCTLNTCEMLRLEVRMSGGGITFATVSNTQRLCATFCFLFCS